jgi:hypothetical protein
MDHVLATSEYQSRHVHTGKPIDDLLPATASWSVANINTSVEDLLHTEQHLQDPS